MFHLMFSLPALYLTLRFLYPLSAPPAVKLLIAAALIVFSQYHLWSRLSSGSVFNPEFPRPLIVLMIWGFASILILAVFQLAADAASLVVAAFARRLVAQPAELRYAMAAVAMALTAFGVRNALIVPPVKSVEVAIAGLDPRLDGFRLVQLTDLHLSRLFPRDWAERLVERTNAVGADLIVVTGDLIDGTLDERRADVAPLAALRAPSGVFVSPGNHEYFFGYESWMAHYAGLGMTGLANAHTVIRRDGAGFVLAGVTDLSAAATGREAPDLNKALTGAPEGLPVILLDHQPMQAAASAAAGVVLQLSGHTHGGMIRGLDLVVARANNGFVSGAYRIGGMTLYVNNGTALWPGMAVRLGRPSELTVFTLRAA